MARETRQLLDLVSVGPATVRDLHRLNVTTVSALAECDAVNLYRRLCDITGVRQDPCVKDVFDAAIAQARDPDLPEEKKQWHYWSRRRKRAISS